ncbi:MAG: SRPBCC family protein [Phenylobacterium sp.]
MHLKLAAAAIAVLTVTGATAAYAEDFVTIPLETTVNAPADKAWPKISGYCLIGTWFKTTCTVSGPDGQMGSVRTIAGRVRELLVAKTAWSYTYSQPKSPIDYHGTVEIQPIDKKTSKLMYTLVYDADALPKHEAEDKAKDKDQRTKQFTGLLATMKAAAEAK